MNTKIQDNNQHLNLSDKTIPKTNNGAIIDAILVFVFSLVVLFTLPGSLLSKLEGPVTPGLFIFIVFAIYRLVALLLYKKTIGMHLSKSRLLNSNLEPLSKKKIFLLLSLYLSMVLIIMKNSMDKCTRMYYTYSTQAM